MNNIATLDVAGLLRAIRVHAEQHNSGDTYAEGKAIEALQQGRPVFWTTARYHNQAACCLHYDANRDGLAAALEANPHFAAHIGTLIPLTPSATVALEEARWQIAGGLQAAE